MPKFGNSVLKSMTRSEKNACAAFKSLNWNVDEPDLLSTTPVTVKVKLSPAMSAKLPTMAEFSKPKEGAPL